MLLNETPRKAKYATCTEALEQIKSDWENKEILVPLTGSMYVPDVMKIVDNFVIDMGTGYYVEKNLDDTKDYFKAFVHARVFCQSFARVLTSELPETCKHMTELMPERSVAWVVKVFSLAGLMPELCQKTLACTKAFKRKVDYVQEQSKQQQQLAV